ncbi:MAG: hypothetical protein H6826_02215 [Planctomycetes bacterium]|nr:hypothetical protein [Planctomycetota bacterium]
MTSRARAPGRRLFVAVAAAGLVAVAGAWAPLEAGDDGAPSQPVVRELEPLEEPADEEAPAGEPSAADVRRWIEELASRSYAVRETARRQLAEHLDAVRPRLEALREHPDAEVRRAIEALLAGGEPRTRPTESEDGGSGVDASTLGAFDRAKGVEGAAARLDAIVRSVGAQVSWPGQVPETAAPTTDDDLPFWSLLDRLAAVGEARPAESFDTLGLLRLARAMPDAGPVPTVDVGLFRARIVEVTRTRVLGSPQTGVPASLTVQLAWAPALEVRQLTSPRLVEAHDEDGHAWKAAQRGITRMGLSSASGSARIPLVIEPDGDHDGAHLKTLALELPLTVRHGRRELLIDAGTPLPCAVDAEGAPAEPDAAVLRVLTLGEERPGSGSWLAEAVVRLPDGKASTAGLLLVDATGRAVRMHVAAGRVASADGSLHVTGRAWRVEGPPTGIGLAWFDHEDAATLRVAFEDVPLR